MSTSYFKGYKLIRRLAIGGMGELLLAHQRGPRGFKRLVVIKTLLPQHARDATFAELFLHEARIAATLNHPNVVSVIEVGVWEGTHFMVMEYIHGETLDVLTDVLTDGMGGIDPHLAALIVHDAALALDHAHTARSVSGEPLGIVHRDVSPQNIMVRDDGMVKIVDFGIARATDRPRLTRTGVVRGKVRYMSPEQMQAGDAIDARADQFSLGVVLWELCTGRPLFAGRNDIEIARAVMTEQPVPLDDIAEQCPEGLSEIAARMLRFAPDERFASCHDVAEELSGLLGETSLVALRRQLANALVGLLGPDLEAKKAPTTSGLNPILDRRASMAVGAETMESQTGAGGADRLRRRGFRVAPIAWLTGVVVLVGTAAWLIAGRDGSGAFEEPRAPTPSDVTAAPGSPSVTQRKTAAILRIQTTPQGATALLDGRVRGQTPTVLRGLAPGRRLRIGLRRAGYVPQTTEIVLSEGESRTLRVPLVKQPPATDRTKRAVISRQTEKGTPGFLTLRTQPWTTVHIDGRPHGASPIYRARLEPGRHVLHLVNEAAGISVERRVNVKPGVVTKLDLDLRASSSD